MIANKHIHDTLVDILDKYDLDCYVTFLSDSHLNEYVGDKDKQIEILTGFSGSNGITLTFSNRFIKNIKNSNLNNLLDNNSNNNLLDNDNLLDKNLSLKNDTNKQKNNITHKTLEILKSLKKIVENDNACGIVWTDSRYYIQCNDETDYILVKDKISIIITEICEVIRNCYNSIKNNNLENSIKNNNLENNVNNIKNNSINKFNISFDKKMIPYLSYNTLINLFKDINEKYKYDFVCFKEISENLVIKIIGEIKNKINTNNNKINDTINNSNNANTINNIVNEDVTIKNIKNNVIKTFLLTNKLSDIIYLENYSLSDYVKNAKVLEHIESYLGENVIFKNENYVLKKSISSEIVFKGRAKSEETEISHKTNKSNNKKLTDNDTNLNLNKDSNITNNSNIINESILNNDNYDINNNSILNKERNLSKNNLTGSSYQEKIKKIRKDILHVFVECIKKHHFPKMTSEHKKSLDAAIVVSALDTIAWILNLRGSDIEYNPVFYAYLIIYANKLILFTDADVYLSGVEVRPYDSFYDYVNKVMLTDSGISCCSLENLQESLLGSSDVTLSQMRKKNIVYLISDNTNAYLGDKILLHNNLTLQKTNIFDKESLNNIIQAKDYYNMFFTNKVIYMQATKNNAEIAGMILSYFYDGIALCNTFGEIEKVLKDKKEILTEIMCSDILLGHKKKFKDFFIQPSFETISSIGANCAIIHHTPGSDEINPCECYLMDSGSQYMFGTTDTTRTVLFSNFKKENKEESDKFLDKEYYEKLVHDNTLVLKCHLNVMISSYSKSNTWEMVDSRGREFLQKENKDYGHSLSHGVGHFLNVHEHPPIVRREDKSESNSKNNDKINSSNKKQNGDDNKITFDLLEMLKSSLNEEESQIRPNFVFSNEPGYYLDGEYGIRIENLVYSSYVKNSSDKEIYFNNFTMVPYDLSLIDVKMLSKKEVEYLNEINQKIYDLLHDSVNEDGLMYLKKNTRKIII